MRKYFRIWHNIDPSGILSSCLVVMIILGGMLIYRMPDDAMAQASTVYTSYNSDGCEYNQDKNGVVLSKRCPPQWSAGGQDVAANKPAPKPKVEDKKAPDVIPIPDARKDKVQLIQKDVELAGLRMKEIERLYKEQQDLQKAAMEKWQVELMSALKLAGVDDKDFASYEYNRDTMTFTKKKEAEKPKQ